MIPLTPPPSNLWLDLSERKNAAGAWLPWNGRSGARKVFVDRFRVWASKNQHERCAFCMLSFGAGPRRTADLDHLVPKANSKYPEWTYEALNLVIACSWCNQRIKRAQDFLLPPKPAPTHYSSVQLSIVHPYLDQDRSAHFLGGYLGGASKPRAIRGISSAGKATIKAFEIGTPNHLEMWRQEYRGAIRRQRQEVLPGGLAGKLHQMMVELRLRA